MKISSFFCIFYINALKHYFRMQAHKTAGSFLCIVTAAAECRIMGIFLLSIFCPLCQSRQNYDKLMSRILQQKADAWLPGSAFRKDGSPSDNIYEENSELC
jgi:hypothetical protein